MRKFQQTREVIKYAKKYIFGRTLDLGAGSAKYKEIIKEKAAEYVTFDLVPGENIDIVGNILNSPFEDESFDTVISTQVLEHVEKPWIMIKEIHRILRKNGICILTAPFMVPYHPDPHDFFRYTKEGIDSLFKNEGFKVIDCNYYGQTFSVLLEMIHFIFFNPYTKKSGIWSWRLLRYLAKIAKFMDRFVKTKIVYANIYIIAKK